jgi:hypothetical protein
MYLEVETQTPDFLSPKTWTDPSFTYPMDPNTEKVLNPPNYSKLYTEHFLRRYLDP